MSQNSTHSGKHVLEPIERVSEILFGLIMVLTFTGSLSVADSAREDVRAMLIGAIGCNIAWGLVDAIMFLMSSLTERARSRVMIREVRQSPDAAAGQRHIVDALPEVIASVITEQELESMRQRVQVMPDAAGGPMLSKQDWLGALGVFVLVFASTFPVVLPFLFMNDVRLALRVSNGIAIVMLFACGYSLGKFAGYRPLVIGFVMVVVGVVLAGLTLALGG